MKVSHLLPLLLVCLLTAAMHVSAEDGLKITAKSVASSNTGDSRETDLTEATAIQNGMKLYADRMVIRTEEDQHVLTATGAARLQDAVSIITGDTITMDTAAKMAGAAGHAVLEMTAKAAEGQTEGTKLVFTADALSYDYQTHKARLTGYVTLKLPEMSCLFGDAVVEYDWQEGKLMVRPTAVEK
ncbi:MAG: hypothetical protein ACYC6A_02955 [Armatimonadota bacterium]